MSHLVPSRQAREASQPRHFSCRVVGQLHGCLAADLIGLRITEIHWPVQLPSWQQLLVMETRGRYDIAIDAVTDCRDLYELVTGQKGVPQDKAQRLIIMALRERRMIGRTRHYFWTDTNSMLANGLTKLVANDPLISNLLTTGTLQLPTAGTALLRRTIATN